MSNYDRISFNDGDFVVGHEMIDGTGKVYIHVKPAAEGGGECVYYDAETTLKLAKLLADEAFAALCRKWKVENINA